MSMNTSHKTEIVKEKYEKAWAEIIVFDSEDILTASGGDPMTAILRNSGVKQTQLDVHSSPWDTN